MNAANTDSDKSEQHLVQDALKIACQGRACIVVNQKLTNILNSHEINVIKNGTVIETSRI